MYLDVIIEMASAQLEQLGTSFVDHYDEKCKPSYPFFLYSDQFLCSTFLYNHSITFHFFDSAQKWIVPFSAIIDYDLVMIQIRFAAL